MINLHQFYGNKLFDRKRAYAHTQYASYVGTVILDVILAYAITDIFNVRWDYAFLKVFGLLLLWGFAKQLVIWIMDMISYRVVTKRAMLSEMRHYLSVFDNRNIPWDDIGTYDDYLLEAAFNESLPTDLRVLAAINYGTIVDAMSLGFNYENRSYRLFCQVAPQFF